MIAREAQPMQRQAKRGNAPARAEESLKDRPRISPPADVSAPRVRSAALRGDAPADSVAAATRSWRAPRATKMSTCSACKTSGKSPVSLAGSWAPKNTRRGAAVAPARGRCCISRYRSRGCVSSRSARPGRKLLRDVVAAARRRAVEVPGDARAAGAGPRKAVALPVAHCQLDGINKCPCPRRRRTAGRPVSATGRSRGARPGPRASGR